ncbi:MAG: hypothetical protein MK089_06130 [Phycisphaerales bacterium]|nr:hypothetical protein [Phycisphaerales bacterium]
MRKQNKLRRRPTAAAVIVGCLSLLLSLALVGSCFIFVLLWLKQTSPSLGRVLLWVGPLPLLMTVIWLTLFLMDLFERSTGSSLRTKSVRAGSTDNDQAV